LGIAGDHIIRYRELNLEQIKTRVRELTDGRGVSVAFDFVGGEMKKLCFDVAGFDGRIVSIVEEPPEFDLNIWRADISPFFAKSGTYHFVALSTRARNGAHRDWSVYHPIMSDLASLVETNTLTLPKATELGELSEETISRAHSLLEAGHVKAKLVLTVGKTLTLSFLPGVHCGVWNDGIVEYWPPARSAYASERILGMESRK
jgi:NADPH:quinone reductase-like Zn-dependent oxidoreductase